METAFDAKQFAEPYPDGIESHYWTLARNRIVLEAVRKALGGAAGLVVDVGCGRGITLDYLREHGVDVLGCDMGEATPIKERIRPYLRYRVDAVDLPSHIRDQAKVLLLLDVLEHLPAPAEFLSRLRMAFPGCETVVVTVPARQEVWSNYDEFYGHYLRYDFVSMKKMFNSTEFEVRRVGYLFRLLYLPALALRILRRRRDISIHPPRGWGRLVHRMLATWFVSETRVLPRKLVGTSLMIVLQRR